MTAVLKKGGEYGEKTHENAFSHHKNGDKIGDGESCNETNTIMLSENNNEYLDYLEYHSGHFE